MGRLAGIEPPALVGVEPVLVAVAVPSVVFGIAGMLEDLPSGWVNAATLDLGIGAEGRGLGFVPVGAKVIPGQPLPLLWHLA